MNKLNHIRQMSKEINAHYNTIINTAYWRIYKRIVKSYLRQEKINEISVPTYSELSGLNKEYSLTLLVQLNKEFFAIY